MAVDQTAVKIIERSGSCRIHPNKGSPITKSRPHYFQGRIKDRSYMGGEGSYFIELGADREIHVISMMRTRIYNIGEEVCVQVSPPHCHLIPME